jgi:hypothetical protein
MAFENFIWIQQINSRKGEITYQKLALQINTVLWHDYWQKMLQCILLATANSFDLLDFTDKEWESLKGQCSRKKPGRSGK